MGDERAQRVVIRRATTPPPAAGVGLVIVMALGSVVVWLVSPVVWLWIASQMTDSTQPSLGPYLLVLVGMVLTAVVIGKFLGMVNRAHMRITGRAPDKREPAKWNRSMRGERTPRQRPRCPRAGHGDQRQLRARAVRHLVLRLRRLLAAGRLRPIAWRWWNWPPATQTSTCAGGPTASRSSSSAFRTTRTSSPSCGRSPIAGSTGTRASGGRRSTTGRPSTSPRSSSAFRS